MTHYSDLPQDQKNLIDDVALFLQTEIPIRCSQENLVMRGPILDVILTGSFPNGYAVTDKQYANSDIDIIIVIDSVGAMRDVIYKDGTSPEQTEDMTLIAEGEKHSFRTLSNLFRQLAKEFPDLDYALNVSIRGYDNLFDSLYGAKIGISLLDQAVFETCVDFLDHHEIEHD